MHTADQCDALAGLIPFATIVDTYRADRCRLYALKKEQALLAGLQIIDVKPADDLLSVDLPV